MSRFAKFTGTAVAAAALGLAAFASAGTASAAADDDYFLADIESYGIGYTSESAVIAAGQSVCEMLDNGYSHAEVTKEVFTDTDLSLDKSNYFVESAEIAYCPEYF